MVDFRLWLVGFVMLASCTGSSLSFSTARNLHRKWLPTELLHNLLIVIFLLLVKKKQQLAAFFINQCVLLSFLRVLCLQYSLSDESCSCVVHCFCTHCCAMLMHSLADVAGATESNKMVLHLAFIQ